MMVDRYGNPIEFNTKVQPPVATRVRLTKDRDIYSGLTSFESATKAEEAVDFRLTIIDDEKLARSSVKNMIRTFILSDTSLSRAHSDMQMYVNNGWDLNVEEIGPEAEAAIKIMEDAIDTMSRNQESFNTKLNKLVSSGFLDGAFYHETVFDNPAAEFTEFVDWSIIDPYEMAYREINDDDRRGQHIQYGQIINGEFVPIESDTVMYVPMNPIVDRPVGIPMVSSVLFDIIFLLGIKKAARQVVDSQAWPMGIITVPRDSFAAPFTEGLNAASQASFDTAMKTFVEKVKQDMQNASKNDVFVYGTQVGYEIVGAMGRNNLDAIQMLVSVIDTSIVRGLKQFPVIFGMNSGNALSTNAEQQTEAHVVFIEWFQRLLEESVNHMFRLVLRAQGNQSTPIFAFKKTHEMVNRFRVERFQIKVDALSTAAMAGFISPQEGRTLLRDPEGIDKIMDLLEEELPEEARRINDAQEQVSQQGSNASSGSEETEQTQ